MIELQWEWLGGLPPMRKAAVIGAGSWGTAVAVLLARGGVEVQLGYRTAEQAEAIASKRENVLPAGDHSSPDSITVKRAADIELAGLDLVCLAVPSARCRRRSGAIARPVGPRAVGAAAQQGTGRPARRRCPPSTSTSGSAPARSPRSAARRTPRRRPPGTAALVLGEPRRRPARQLGERLRPGRADLRALRRRRRRRDRRRRQERRLARRGRRRPGTGHQRRRDRHRRGLARVRRLRDARGAEHETFAGIAGVGDLTATILAAGKPQPPRRRDARQRRPGRPDPGASSARPPRGSTRCR